jgi:uncharacterized protein YciI
MKLNLAIAFIILLSASAAAQTINVNYDSLLATRLGADEHGMKSYIFVILKTGSNTTAEKTFLDSCFAQHLKNIGRLVKEEKLVVAGPLTKNDKTYRGIFILNLSTIEEARQLLQTDAAIKSKLLEPEFYQWYGSAALPLYLNAHDKIWKVGL